jgi:hypothetical protein
MECAEEIAQKWYKETYDYSILITNLEGKFIDWALSRHRDLHFGEEMNQKHKNMSDQWREILVTVKTCAKATSMRKLNQHLKKHERKVDAFLEDVKHKRAVAAVAFLQDVKQKRVDADKQRRALAKFRADRTQSRIEDAERIGAAMQAKMQERALC